MGGKCEKCKSYNTTRVGDDYVKQNSQHKTLSDVEPKNQNEDSWESDDEERKE
jgi:hypothetical protein